MRVVLFPTNGIGGALYLSHVTRLPDGTVKSGWVENGHWNFERRDGEALAKSGNYIVNRWPDPGYVEVVVPADWHGGYNEIIERAEAARHG